MGRDNDSGGWIGVVLVFCCLVLFFVNVPGMIVLGYVKTNLLPNLDISQIWTFSLAASFACLTVLLVFTRSATVSMAFYAVLCLSCVGTCLLLYFGFKVKFPGTYLNYFFDIGSYVPVK